MCSIVLAAACLAFVGHAHRVHTPKFQQQMEHLAERMTKNGGDEPDLKTLATLLQVSSPRSAFSLSSPGTQPVTANRNAGVKMQQTQEKFFEKQKKKIAELQAQMVALQQQGHAMPQQQRSPPMVRNDVPVQGGTLKTWSYALGLIDRVQIFLSTNGHPLDADVQLWEEPDNTPIKMKVYSEDGSTRPFNAVMAIPRNGTSTVAVRNFGQTEFPVDAAVTPNYVDEPIADIRETSTTVHGGDLRTFEFDPAVETVQVMLKTDGRPLNAKIELLEGPKNQKQTIELYTEDGLERPFFAVIDTAENSNVVSVTNTAPIDSPMFASVQPHSFK